MPNRVDGGDGSHGSYRYRLRVNSVAGLPGQTTGRRQASGTIRILHSYTGNAAGHLDDRNERRTGPTDDGDVGGGRTLIRCASRRRKFEQSNLATQLRLGNRESGKLEGPRRSSSVFVPRKTEPGRACRLASRARNRHRSVPSIGVTTTNYFAPRTLAVKHSGGQLSRLHPDWGHHFLHAVPIGTQLDYFEAPSQVIRDVTPFDRPERDQRRCHQLATRFLPQPPPEENDDDDDLLLNSVGMAIGGANRPGSDLERRGAFRSADAAAGTSYYFSSRGESKLEKSKELFSGLAGLRNGLKSVDYPARHRYGGNYISAIAIDYCGEKHPSLPRQRLTRILRKFIAGDAIEFANSDPVTFQQLLDRDPPLPFAQPSPRGPSPATVDVTTTTYLPTLSMTGGSGVVGLEAPDSHVGGLLGVGSPSLSVVSLGKNKAEAGTHGSGSDDEESQSNHSMSEKNIAIGLRRRRNRLLAERTSWRHMLIVCIISTLTIRGACKVQRLSCWWGGYSVLIPYTLAVIILVYPVMALELSLGNFVRGGLGQCLGNVSSSFQGVSVVAWISYAMSLCLRATDVGKLSITAVQLATANPDWIAPEASRLDCEQTVPGPDSCVSKQGCIFVDDVCTVYPIYWAQVYADNLTTTYSGHFVIIGVVLMAVCTAFQGLHVRSLGTLLATSTFLGILILLYFAYHDLNQIFTELGYGTLNLSLAVYATTNETVSPTWQQVSSAGMWIAAFSVAADSLQLGKGMLHFCGALAPPGTDLTKMTFWLCLSAIVGAAACVYIGNQMLDAMSYRTGRPKYQMMSVVPDFFESLLPATAGSTLHKKFIVELVILCALLAEFASITMGVSALAAGVTEAPFAARWHRRKLWLALLPSVLVAGLIAEQFVEETMIIQTASIIMSFIVVLVEVLVYGWVANHGAQTIQVGKHAVYGWGLLWSFLVVFGATMALPSLLTLKTAAIVSAWPAWVYQDLPLSAGLIVLTSAIICGAVIFPLRAVKFLRRRYAAGHVILSQDRASSANTPLAASRWGPSGTMLQSLPRHFSAFTGGEAGRFSYGTYRATARRASSQNTVAAHWLRVQQRVSPSRLGGGGGVASDSRLGSRAIPTRGPLCAQSPNSFTISSSERVSTTNVPTYTGLRNFRMTGKLSGRIIGGGRGHNRRRSLHLDLPLSFLGPRSRGILPRPTSSSPSGFDGSEVSYSSIETNHPRVRSPRSYPLGELSPPKEKQKGIIDPALLSSLSPPLPNVIPPDLHVAKMVKAGKREEEMRRRHKANGTSLIKSQCRGVRAARKMGCSFISPSSPSSSGEVSVSKPQGSFRICITDHDNHHVQSYPLPSGLSGETAEELLISRLTVSKEGQSNLNEEVTSRRQHVIQHALWWLWLGNIELLRHELNTMAGPKVARLSLFWSLCVKYIIPLLLGTMIAHAAADICASMSGNLRFVWGSLDFYQIGKGYQLTPQLAVCLGLWITPIAALLLIVLIPLVLRFSSCRSSHSQKEERTTSRRSSSTRRHAVTGMFPITFMTRTAAYLGLNYSWRSLKAYFLQDFLGPSCSKTPSCRTWAESATAFYLPGEEDMDATMELGIRPLLKSLAGAGTESDANLITAFDLHGIDRL